MYFKKYFLLDAATDNPPVGDPPPVPPVPPVDDPPAPPPIQSVSQSDYDKLQARLTKRDEENVALNATLKKREEDTLKDNQDWKELSELRETERDAANTENENLKKGLVRREKMSAVRTAAMQSGIKKEALDDLDNYDWTGVEIETTSLGNFNVIGAKAAIEAFKIKKPFFFGKTSSNLNGGLPEVVGDGTVTIEQLMKAADKSAKSGAADDQAAYQNLHNKYKQQQKR